MILGMSVATFTLLHVLISLVALASGAVALGAMIGGRPPALWNSIFLATTAATSITGFFFHSPSFGPPHVIGLISLVVLAVAYLALYLGRLRGVWRPVYAVAATFGFYLNAFVGIVQAFQKIPALAVAAPTQSEPPFLVAQIFLLIAIIVIGFLAARRLGVAASVVTA
jgi:uncharacterized membrane protein